MKIKMVKRKYIAPNAITAAGLFLGYLSITASIKGEFIRAIVFIILAMVCDGLDGKTARKLDAFSVRNLIPFVMQFPSVLLQVF